MTLPSIASASGRRDQAYLQIAKHSVTCETEDMAVPDWFEAQQPIFISPPSPRLSPTGKASSC